MPRCSEAVMVARVGACYYSFFYNLSLICMSKDIYVTVYINDVTCVFPICQSLNVTKKLSLLL